MLQRMMQIKEGALGFGLIGAAMGTLVSLSFSGPILERIGYRRSLLTLLPLLALLYALASWAGGPLSFFLLLFPVGIVIGGIEIILNLEADRTEHLVGHRIMNRAHAFWSFGFFSAGIISALAAQWGLSLQLHLFFMVPLVGRRRGALSDFSPSGLLDIRRPLSDGYAGPNRLGKAESDVDRGGGWINARLLK